VVWHFYWVIFDPKEYPMNPSWLIGKKAAHKPNPPEPAPPAASPEAETPDEAEKQ